MRLSDIPRVSLAQQIIGSADIRVSFSQFAEDLLLLNILSLHDRVRPKGFYIDVGAGHPVRDSNSHLLRTVYGWTGLNIDAIPDNIALFDHHAPDCQNICGVISDIEEDVTFSVLDQPGMSTADSAMLERATKLGRTINSQHTMRTRRLADVIASSFQDVPPIDFLSVDVEGYDLRVLRSNDWEKYRPLIVMVEDLPMDLERLSESPTKTYMNSIQYNLIAFGFATSFYRDRRV